MRILHTADWHLGIALHGATLADEQREVVDALLETVRAQRIDAVVIAGDVFDHAVANPDAIRLYNDAMVALCRDCGVAVLVIAGNHDGAARLAACGELLRGAGLFIAGKLDERLSPVVVGDAAFFLLPYFSLDEARILFPTCDLRGYADAMAAITERMRGEFVPGKRNILVAHCFASGGEVSESDRAAVVGGSGQVSLSAFAGFDYVALGHLHRAQQFGNVRYAGTPFPYAFAEAGQAKSFTVYDTAIGAISECPVVTTRTVRSVRGEEETLWTQAQFDVRREDYLRVELTDRYAGVEALARFREVYPNLLLLTGRTVVGGEAAGISVEQLAGMGEVELVERFCEEITSEKLGAQRLEWFLDAAKACEREVAQ